MKALLTRSSWYGSHRMNEEDVIEVTTLEELVELTKKEDAPVILQEKKCGYHSFEGITPDDYDIELEVYDDYRE